MRDNNMEIHEDEIQSLWEGIRSHWIKYCGVVDEYRMLRDRWSYSSKEYTYTLPEINDAFKSLDSLIHIIGDQFRELSFDRRKIEDYQNFEELIASNEDLIEFNQIFHETRDRLFNLVTYTGLLKLAFFQRTVSSEIPHVASGYPHSPERTIGNEMFYLAADNVAKSYYDCLNLKSAKWDGFITFAPPKEAISPYGALFKASSDLPIFHISMSEEQKYFVGIYLALAHEFGHSVLYDQVNIYNKIRDTTYIYWYKGQKDFIEQLKKDFKSSDNLIQHLCDDCLYDPLKKHYWDLILNEIFADIIAVYIGGPNVLEAYLDEIFRVSFYIPLHKEKIIAERKLDVVYVRMNAVAKYFSVFNYYNIDISNIEKRINSMIKNSIRIMTEIQSIENNNFDSEKWNIEENICLKCLKRFGSEIGEKLGERDKVIYEKLNTTVFSAFAKKSKFFNVRKKDKKIVDYLSEGIPVQDVDPRIILHYYYEAYKKSLGENRPNYAATIYSLAFNEK